LKNINNYVVLNRTKKKTISFPKQTAEKAISHVKEGIK
jgi:hypothetical protein